jgi:hypothetical protein
MGHLNTKGTSTNWFHSCPSIPQDRLRQARHEQDQLILNISVGAELLEIRQHDFGEGFAAEEWQSFLGGF